MSIGVCVCGSNAIAHYDGEPERQPKNCPRHGLQRVIEVCHVDPPQYIETDERSDYAH